MWHSGTDTGRVVDRIAIPGDDFNSCDNSYRELRDGLIRSATDRPLPDHLALVHSSHMAK